MKNKSKRNFAIIQQLCAELYRIKTGERKPNRNEIKETQDFWVKFIGFNNLTEMTSEDLKALEQVLLSRISSERKRLGLPGVSKWYQI